MDEGGNDESPVVEEPKYIGKIIKMDLSAVPGGALRMTDEDVVKAQTRIIQQWRPRREMWVRALLS